MVEEHRGEYGSQWDTICAIASMIGCSAESLRRWMKMERQKNSASESTMLSDKERIKELERENRALKKSNEILRLASAYFAKAELDRQQK
jgi:transposase